MCLAYSGNVPDLMIASVFIQQGDDWFDMILLDDIQHLWTLNQNTIQHLKDSCDNNVTIYEHTIIGSVLFGMVEKHNTMKYNDWNKEHT